MTTALRWLYQRVEDAACWWVARRLPPAQPRRVLLVSQMAYTGGTFTFFRNTVEALQQAGWSVDLALLERSPSSKVLEYCRSHGVTAFRVSPQVTALSLLHVGALVRRGRYSLVMGSSGGLDFYSLLLAFRRPVFLVLHTVIHRPLSKRNLALLKRWLRPEHRLVAVSRAAMATVVQHASRVLLPSTATFLYNYVSDRSGPRTPRLSVVTLGHVTEYKNPWLWIEVARHVLSLVPGVTFTWVGTGDQLDQCRAAVSEPGIRFVGFHRNVDEFLASAAVLFHPSKTESFGLAVAEAMMWGVPSVVSDAGALPELVDHGVNGLVYPVDDSEAAVKALLRLLRLPQEERDQWGRNARLRYEERFTAPSWVASFQALLPPVQKEL